MDLKIDWNDLWKEIRKHSVSSANILKPLIIFDDVTDIIRQHHERYDGKGYPLGIKGEDIPIGARIIAVADAYESMTNERPHRPAFSDKDAIKELKKNSGKQFDPTVVRVFLNILKALQGMNE